MSLTHRGAGGLMRATAKGCDPKGEPPNRGISLDSAPP
jgi:hypothetical protein